jgi:hypothetical protein
MTTLLYVVLTSKAAYLRRIREQGSEPTQWERVSRDLNQLNGNACERAFSLRFFLFIVRIDFLVAQKGQENVVADLNRIDIQ